MRTTVAFKHFLLALLVVAVWGSNFTFIKMGLADLPPLFFAALRFGLAAFPAVFFIKKPAVAWRNIMGYGLFIGFGAFGLLFFAMRAHISPGLASLIMQLQVFFTVLLAVYMHRERLRFYQLVAALAAASGIVVIGLHTDGTTTLLGVLLVSSAAFCWGLANMTSRAAGQVDMLGYIVWASLFAAPPLLLLSLLTEGWPAISLGVRNASWQTWLVVLWQALGNTIFGFGVWAWLLSRYPAASIVPMALLVPVFGMATSALLLAEPIPGWKLLAAGLVVLGLGLNVLWPLLGRARWVNK